MNKRAGTMNKDVGDLRPDILKSLLCDNNPERVRKSLSRCGYRILKTDEENLELFCRLLSTKDGRDLAYSKGVSK